MGGKQVHSKILDCLCVCIYIYIYTDNQVSLWEESRFIQRYLIVCVYIYIYIQTINIYIYPSSRGLHNVKHKMYGEVEKVFHNTENSMIETGFWL